MTGSYDPELNLTYWGTGNPGPDFNGDKRGGDNLYSDRSSRSIPIPARLKWHFQFTPHDEFDYDSTQVPVLADIEWQGRPRKVDAVGEPQRVLVRARSRDRRVSLGQAVREGHVDRVGSTRAAVRMNVVKPTREGTVVFPHLGGATNWYSPSYSPRTGLFYVPAWIRHLRHVLEAAGRIRRGPIVSRRVSDGRGYQHQRRADQPPAARGRHGRRRCARSEDRREASGSSR